MKDKFFRLIKEQLTQGVPPQKIAFTISLGVTLGIFPILGSTTLLCLAAGTRFKLNQPLLQTVNYFAYPLQIIFIPVFIRLGETLFRAPHVPFSIPAALALFSSAPSEFIKIFWLSALQAVAAWSLAAIPFTFLAYWTAEKFLSRAKPS